MGAKSGEQVKLNNTQIEGMVLSEEITLESIHFFDISLKVKNDFYTRKRELIIYNILKSEIPISFYKDSRWFQLKEGLFKIMSEFIPYHIIPGGGRLPYDFEIITKNHKVKLDLKFNVQNIKSYPQVIDIRSDKLGDFCYATYYYNYSGIKKIYISLENYLKHIWKSDGDTKDVFFFDLKKKYKTDSGFKKKNQALVRESIKSYIKVVNLDIIKINEIIIKINKIYLLYYEGNWQFDKNMLNHDIIVLYKLGYNHNSIYYSTNKNILKIYLCWKNNMGVLVPIWKLQFVKKLPKNIVNKLK